MNGERPAVQHILYVPDRSIGAFQSFLRSRPELEWEQSPHQHATHSVRVYVRSTLNEDDRRVLAEAGVTVKHNSPMQYGGAR